MGGEEALEVLGSVLRHTLVLLAVGSLVGWMDG